MLSGEQTFPDTYQLMKDRVALVTGGSRGIGAATALLLGRYGARVGVNYYQNEAAAQRVVSTIEQAGGQALAIQADAANAEQVEAMVRSVGEALGPIDTLVLNAPAFGNQGLDVLAPFLQSQWESFELAVRAHLQSAFYLCKAVMPTMIQHQQGSIIFVSATIARRPVPGAFALTVGKASVESMVRELAEELGPYGIRVNAVGGGHILTDINAFQSQETKDQFARTTPLRRSGQPEEVAAAIVFLASNQASFVTGAYLTVDGGRLIM